MTPAHPDYLADVLAERLALRLADLALVQLGVFALLAMICGLMVGLCAEPLVPIFTGCFAICAWEVGCNLHRYRTHRKATRP